MGDPREIAEAKLQLRQRLRGQRATVRGGWEARLVDTDAYRDAPAVAAFVGVRHEPDTRVFLARVLADQKRLYLPAMAPDETMRMARVDALEGLVEAGFGLTEPPLPAADQLVDEVAALVVVPGLAFDRHGVRLGHGRGHYDRWFARVERRVQLTCVGLCTDDRVVEAVPSGPHDRRMDAVLTPGGFVLEGSAFLS